ncbi:MAG: NADH-quinone oxidoreductase subunit N [Bradymonadia bacterium]
MNITFEVSDLLGVLPVIILCLFGLAAMFLEVFAQKGASRGFIGTVSVLGFVVAFVVNQMQWEGKPFSDALFGGMLVNDTYAAFFNMIFLAGGLLAVLMSRKYLAEHKMDHGEYYALMIFSAAGMCLMAASRDLIVLFVALEIMSVAVYVLTGYLRRNRKSAEGALKYFLMGAFASGILLYGVALLYGATGSTDMVGIREALEGQSDLAGSTLVKLGVALILVGLGFKVALAPFHFWAPDVYTGAPSPVTAFMAVGVKAAGFAALVRLFTIAFGLGDLQFGLPVEGAEALAGVPVARDGNGWVGVVYFLAILTMFAGNLGAIAQSNVKRMLAYSSVSHAGYLLVGVVAGAMSPGSEATSAIMYYLLTYTFSTFLAFGVIALFGKGGEEYTHYSDFAGVGFKKPFLGLALMLGVLSLAGIPPLAGFFGKFYLFKEAMAVGSPQMTTLVIIAIINSMIALYYYLRVIVFLYMKPATREVPMFTSHSVTAVLVISLALVVILGVFPDDYLEMARSSLLSLGPQ